MRVPNILETHDWEQKMSVEWDKGDFPRNSAQWLPPEKRTQRTTNGRSGAAVVL